MCFLLNDLEVIQQQQNDADDDIDLNDPTNDAQQSADDGAQNGNPTGQQASQSQNNTGQDSSYDVNNDLNNQSIGILRAEGVGKKLLQSIHNDISFYVFSGKPRILLYYYIDSFLEMQVIFALSGGEFAAKSA